MLAKTEWLVSKLIVYPEQMQKNIDLTGGLMHSQQALLLLTEKGLSREDAYRIVQASAMKSWQTKVPLRKLLEADPLVAEKVTARDFDKVFDIRTHFRDVNRTFKLLGL